MKSSVFDMLSGEGGAETPDIMLAAPEDMVDKVLMLRTEAAVEVRLSSAVRFR